MRVKFVWSNDIKKWYVYEVKGYLRWKKFIPRGTVDAPKGAHFKTVAEEFSKYHKVLEGRI